MSTSISFTVPYLTPPSVNHYSRKRIWRDQRGNPILAVYKTKEAKAFLFAVAMFCQGQSVIPETAAEEKRVKYQVTVDVWLGPNQRLDADNAGKVALDALQYARVIHSDAYVSNCTLNIHKDERHNPRTQFTVARSL